MTAYIHGFPIFSITTLLLYPICALLGYFFCLLLLSGYELRRRSKLDDMPVLPEEYFSNQEEIKRAMNVQAALGGLALGAVITVILHAGC